MKLPQFVVLPVNKLREFNDKVRELGNKLRDSGNKVREFADKVREFTLKFPPSTTTSTTAPYTLRREACFSIYYPAPLRNSDKSPSTRL